MSDFRAIGGASATLQALLSDRMELPDWLTSVPVTIGQPPFSSKDTDPRKEDPRVNVFLYRVTENGFLQNQEIPGSGSRGAYGRPPLSLNLHYLITAYGNAEVQVTNGSSLWDDSTAHLLLGSAMRVFHDVPIITEKVSTVRPPTGLAVLDESLRDAYEKVRLSLEPLTLEDITKVWTALGLRFRLSAAYVVNVVQIESRGPRTFPRPVGQPVSATVPPQPSDPPSPGPWVYLLTIQTPTITELRVRRLGETTEQAFPYARIGDTLVLRGTSLSGPETSVRFGDLTVPALVATPIRVEAEIPDASVPGGGVIQPEPLLQPGVRTVSVVTRDPLLPQSAFSSNSAAFMLVPTVDPTKTAYSAGPPRKLTIEGSRLVFGAGGETIIGRTPVPRPYLAEDPEQIEVLIPAALPMRGVKVIVGSAIATNPVVIGGGPLAFEVKIGAVTKTISPTLPASIARDQLAGIVARLIRDLPGVGEAFLKVRVELWHDRLVLLPGDLASDISITSPSPSSLAAKIGLTAAQPPGAANAYISGALTSAPQLSSGTPRLQLTIASEPPVILEVPAPSALEVLAEDLNAAIVASSPAPAFADAQVMLTGSQLLVIPGTANAVTFEAAPGDETTVAELQLHAKFAVRVRANGTESIDPAFVELPQ
jgi:hypothetical protein